MSNISKSCNFPEIDPKSGSKCVRVCQNRTCKKQGATEVLTAFVALEISDVTVMASGCLGQCGNGPMVLVLPDMVWYCGVRPDEVPLVVEQHLLGGECVKKMLYSRFHTEK
ncbi:(2Fe-2S) ferredoxin domain-containing protein [Nodularia harveyana UHCC-0300]|uniref:(2Fe-2S) ferredoxin domain-containing protein n=1 Tax=Nodularia harveyana UHCC-0300 TaxID=2974287 RepID=A0ABU5UGQ2_9CYAN|nr:(2Fe-2S) ferredoxin domain-containing protein [Nodularia harveyana]MEA5582695.1 (2Fe-2S) ferredoxin domain-containing protein [Nodularia harveyana UHCC-0300]